MDWKVRRLNQEVKKHDRTLFVYKSHNGMIQVWRRGETFSYDWFTEGNPERKESSVLQFILPLTDDWSLRGRPVDWGLEPVLHKLKSMDNWSHPDLYEDHYKRKMMEEDDKERSKRNKIRAVANDMRSDLAKATNDYVFQRR